MSEDDEAKGDAGTSLDVQARLGEDFTTRLLSGLVMGVVAALFTVSGAAAFSVLVVAVTLLLSWEWGRLVHGREADVVVAVHVGTAAVATVLSAVGFVGLGLLALPIGAILALLLSLGLNAVIFVILAVIVSDTAGFLIGRLVGGPKLWPRISPNKTWSGSVGAIVATAVVAAMFWLAVPGGSPLHLAAAGALLSVVAQVGDLAESALKRRFGAKDSGSLIPGHGGVMDRVDGLVAAAAAVALAGFVINVHSPAQALLLGS